MTLKNKKTKTYLFIFGFSELVLVDQVIKFVSLYQNWDNNIFKLSRNHNCLFGLFETAWVQKLSLFFSILLLFGIFIYIIKKFSLLPLKSLLGWTLILAGGFSNTFDRLINGFVVDYISCRFSNFNLADVYIFAGIILLILPLSRKIKI